MFSISPDDVSSGFDLWHPQAQTPVNPMMAMTFPSHLSSYDISLLLYHTGYLRILVTPHTRGMWYNGDPHRVSKCHHVDISLTNYNSTHRYFSVDKSTRRNFTNCVKLYTYTFLGILLLGVSYPYIRLPFMSLSDFH